MPPNNQQLDSQVLRCFGNLVPETSLLSRQLSHLPPEPAPDDGCVMPDLRGGCVHRVNSPGNPTTQQPNNSTTPPRRRITRLL